MQLMKKGVMQTTDAQFGWILGIIALAVAAGIYTYYSNDNTYSIAAQHAVLVSDAADKYITDNFDTIVAQATPTQAFTFNVATLKNAGYLPPAFSEVNRFSQDYRIMVLEPSTQKLQTLVVTLGGTTLSTSAANKIALRIGANGAYIDSGTAYGTAWTEALAKYGFDPGNGHVAIAQFFKNGVSSNDFLYRKAVAGHPELNMMSTDLSMGGHDLTTVRNVTATDTVTTGTVRTAGETYTGGWFRTTGDTGWYSEKWGGGFHMKDSKTIVAYNGKDIYSSGQIHGGTLRADGNASVGGEIELDAVRIVGTACPKTGNVARDAAGAPLSCQSGVWQKSTISPTVTQIEITSSTKTITGFDYCAINFIYQDNGGPQCGITPLGNRKWSAAGKSDRDNECIATCLNF